jgi:divalent metal cation (Fe/Co/Zn/Cd) transporter
MIVNESLTRRWTRLGLRLVLATMVYNMAEAVIALWSGAAADSIALLGYGLDSIIETIAAGVLLWRLRLEARGAERARVEAAEQQVQRLVGGTFIALALYVLAQAGWMLWQQQAAGESSIGIILALASLVIMPLVAVGKLRVADRIGSDALRAEAKETLACSYLSFTLLLGLLGNATVGWWWADPVAAVLMVPWLVKEGVEGLRSEGCCH